MLSEPRITYGGEVESPSMQLRNFGTLCNNSQSLNCHYEPIDKFKLVVQNTLSSVNPHAKNVKMHYDQKSAFGEPGRTCRLADVFYSLLNTFFLRPAMRVAGLVTEQGGFTALECASGPLE